MRGHSHKLSYDMIKVCSPTANGKVLKYALSTTEIYQSVKEDKSNLEARGKGTFDSMVRPALTTGALGREKGFAFGEFMNAGIIAL